MLMDTEKWIKRSQQVRKTLGDVVYQEDEKIFVVSGYQTVKPEKPEKPEKPITFDDHQK